MRDILYYSSNKFGHQPCMAKKDNLETNHLSVVVSDLIVVVIGYHYKSSNHVK